MTRRALGLSKYRIEPLALRRIKLRISALIFGRLGFLDRDDHRQYQLKPYWCHRPPFRVAR